MEQEKKPQQFELLLDAWQNLKVTGQNLSGDIDFMFGRIIEAFQDNELKTILSIKPTLFATDTNGNTVEAECEIIINIYKYEHQFSELDFYGLFCHAYIVFYHLIRAEIERQKILLNGELYLPTMSIPGFEMVKDDIREELAKMYG